MMMFSFLSYWLEKILSFAGGPFKAFQHEDLFFFFSFSLIFIGFRHSSRTVHWNPVNTVTNGPKTLGRIKG